MPFIFCGHPSHILWQWLQAISMCHNMIYGWRYYCGLTAAGWVQASSYGYVPGPMQNPQQQGAQPPVRRPITIDSPYDQGGAFPPQNAGGRRYSAMTNQQQG